MSLILKPVAAAAILLSALAGSMAAQGVPTINIAPSCRAAAKGNVDITQSYDSCIRSEEDARRVLVKQWNSFNAADRASCHRLTTTGTPGTYTELLTCLEMKRDARKLPYDDSTVGLGTRAPKNR